MLTKIALAILGLIAVALIGNSAAAQMDKQSLEIAIGFVIVIIFLLIAAMTLWRSIKSHLQAAASFREQMDSVADQRKHNLQRQRTDSFESIESPSPKRGSMFESLFRKNSIKCRLIQEQTISQNRSFYMFRMGLGVRPRKIIEFLNSVTEGELRTSQFTFLKTSEQVIEVYETQNGRKDWSLQ